MPGQWRANRTERLDRCCPASFSVPIIIVSCNGLVGRRWRNAIPVNLDKGDMSIDEAHDAFGITIGFLTQGVPRATEESGKLSRQDRLRRVWDRPQLFARDARQAARPDLVAAERVAGEGVSDLQMQLGV